MKIEKLSENKIRFTFNNLDLEKNNIDVHSFMSNSIESQSLFLNMLNQAEREIGFATDGYKLSIEALALSNGIFIITVTRIEKENFKPSRVQPRRKTNLCKNNTLIYKFSCFDDFCNFQNFLSVSLPNLINKFSESNSLYKYNNSFFLICENINNQDANLLSSIISEFAIFINYSDLVIHKIKEYGLFVGENTLHKAYRREI